MEPFESPAPLTARAAAQVAVLRVVLACARCGTTEAAAAARGAPAAFVCKKCKHEVGAAFRPVGARARRPRSCALRPKTRKRGLRDRGRGGGPQDVLHAHNPSAGYVDLTNCKAPTARNKPTNVKRKRRPIQGEEEEEAHPDADEEVQPTKKKTKRHALLFHLSPHRVVLSLSSK